MDTPPLNTLDNILKYLLDFVVLPVLAYFGKLLKNLYDETLQMKQKTEFLSEKIEKVDEKIEKLEDRLINHIDKGDD